MSCEGIFSVLNFSFQNHRKQSLYRDFFVEQLPDGFHFLPPVVVRVQMRKKVDTLVKRKTRDHCNKLPEILCDFCELVITSLIRTAHELVGHQILTVVNNGNICFHVLQTLLDFAIAVRYHLVQEASLEWERFPGDVEIRNLTFGKIPQTRRLSRSRFSNN